jgi:predicted RNA polymerase sigma factor
VSGGLAVSLHDRATWRPQKMHSATRSSQHPRALSAHLLGCLGRAGQAKEAHARAIGLSEDTAVRDFLVSQPSAVGSG